MKGTAIFWTAAAAALVVLAAAIFLRHAGRRTIPGQASYPALPAPFNAALARARDAVKGGGFAPADLRSLGRLLQANRQNGDARACYELAAARGGKLDARDHYYLADIALYDGDLGRGAAELRLVVDEAPDYLPARLELAEALFKSGDANGAEAAYRGVLERVADQPQAMFGLARIELQAGRDDQAQARLERLLAVHRDMTSAAGLLSQVLDRRGDGARADIYRKMSRQRPEPGPGDPWMDALYSECYDLQKLGLRFEEYSSSGQIDLAVPLLGRIEELDPLSPIPPLLRGWTAARAGKNEEAVKEYRAAVARGADPEKICPYLVQALLALDRPGEAEEAAAGFLARKPGSVAILVSYSDAALRRGDKALARTLLGQIVAREPYQTASNLSLASLLWESGDRDGAARCLERVVAVAPADVASRGLLAQYYLGKHQPGLAIGPLEQALSQEKGEAARKNLTAMLLAAYLGAGDEALSGSAPEDSLGYYDKATSLLPENPAGYARKAAASARLGRLADAEAALGRLAQMQPKNPTVYLSLGDVLFREGRADAARADWNRALALAGPAQGPLRSALESRLAGPSQEDLR
ncbi:MAG TPA: tetratricopeptide repeat protein [Opitutaceae bacterium]|jgi:tetratricopeptide (TPR) repeat protein